MPNPYFRFKQFTVYQNDCPLKVCTDACLLGAWVRHHLPANFAEPILDVGAGTGLLSLMLAQDTRSSIEAVEINHLSALQAAANFKLSPWKDRLRLHEKDFAVFTTAERFGLIISNPPFFEQSLQSNDPGKNAAKHEVTLQWTILIGKAATLLSATGLLAILIPWHRTKEAIRLAEKNLLHLHRQAEVRSYPDSNFFRTMLLFGKLPADTISEEITVKVNEKEYSPVFANLLQPFYLHL